MFICSLANNDKKIERVVVFTVVPNDSHKAIDIWFSNQISVSVIIIGKIPDTDILF